MAHAQLSPSSAARWMACPGSVALSAGLPDESSSFADEGTDAHELASMCLESGMPTLHYMGLELAKGHKVDADMASYVQQYVDYVRGIADAQDAQLLVEQRLPLSEITGEPGAHGTADAVVLLPGELAVADLKYGRGVPVDAEDNPQLQIYALAAMAEFSLVHEFTQVRMVIHQPRLNSVSEWVQTVEQLEAFGEKVREAAAMCDRARTLSDPEALVDLFLRPTDKGCKFCKAAATCPALRADVIDQFEKVQPVDGTTPEDDLADSLAMADRIEAWLKAVRAEVERRLLAGEPVRGFKLVQGKRGARAWTDPQAAESLLKDTFRLKTEQVYDLKLISPTSAEKLAKAGEIGPRQWPKVEALITQPDGKPSVAPESDKRPALVMSAVAADFEDMTESLT